MDLSLKDRIDAANAEVIKRINAGLPVLVDIAPAKEIVPFFAANPMAVEKKCLRKLETLRFFMLDLRCLGAGCARLICSTRMNRYNF